MAAIDALLQEEADDALYGGEHAQAGGTRYVDGPMDPTYVPEGCEGYDHIFFKIERFATGIEFARPDKPIEEFTAKELGTEGERMAASYLERHGYEVRFLNWVTPFGETDIVARDPSGNVVLVEVKTRLALGEDATLMPELAVDPKKRNRYRAMALYYCAINSGLDSVRFDVIAINVIGDHNAKLRHIKGAFEWDEQ